MAADAERGMWWQCLRSRMRHQKYSVEGDGTELGAKLQTLRTVLDRHRGSVLRLSREQKASAVTLSPASVATRPFLCDD